VQALKHVIIKTNKLDFMQTYHCKRFVSKGTCGGCRSVEKKTPLSALWKRAVGQGWRGRWRFRRDAEGFVGAFEQTQRRLITRSFLHMGQNNLFMSHVYINTKKIWRPLFHYSLEERHVRGHGVFLKRKSLKKNGVSAV